MNIWYQSLTKPLFTPPMAYFPIAWSILYFLMLLSFIMVITKPNSKEKLYATNLFFIQLIFNLLWSYIFFEMKSIELALVDVILLLVVLVFTVVYFFKCSKFAGILLLPYLLQVCFALYLNFGILILN